MKIPISDNQVAEQPQGTFNVPGLATPPVSAFGGGVHEATGELGQTVSKMGGLLAEHVADRMRQEQNAQVLQADTDFRRKIQDAIYSTEPDEKTGKPKGVFNRLRSDAAGATVDYDAQANAIMQDSINSLDNPVQKRELAARINDTYETYRRSVIHHEATQIDENRKDIYEANMNQQINDAGILNDPTSLNKAIDRAHHDAYSQLKDYGFDEKTVIPQKLTELSGKMVGSAIGGILEESPDQAQKILDGVSDENLPGAERGKLQKAIDVARRQLKVKKEKESFENFNNNEAEVASLMANGKLTQLQLDNSKEKISDDFYQLASHALKNVGVSEGSDLQKSSKATTLLSEFARINDGDNDTRTKQMINFRKHVLAESTRLDPDQFSALLGLSDPNFVKEIGPEKIGFFKGAVNYIKDFYQKYNSGDASNALLRFVHGAASANPHDIPALAQSIVKGDAIRENPELVGHPDLSNNVVSRSGIKQVTDASSTLKPTQRINGPKAFKPGDEQTKNGITYVRGEDGKWRPKAQ